MRNFNCIGRRGLVVLFLVALFASAKSQVMWNLKGGLMQRSYYDNSLYWGNVIFHGDDELEKRIDWMAGLEMEIPLSNMLNLETGLRYRNHYSLVYPDEEDHGDYRVAKDHLELPLRLTYKQPLGEHFSLHVGVGPYASYALGDDFGGKRNNNLQVGLEPSVAINWACLSLGATYNIPCFYKGYKDENKPVFMATLGIRFKSHVWKYVGATLLAIASVGTAAAAVWPSNDGYSSYSSGSYSPSHSSSSYNSSSSSSSSSSGSISEQQSYISDKGTYANYDSMLSNHFDGSRAATASEVKQWQQAMRNLRTKWTAKGKSFTQSSNETRSTSSCINSSHSH